MEQQCWVQGEPVLRWPEACWFPQACTFDELFEEMHLHYSPLVTAQEFDNKLCLSGKVGADVAVLHAGSNDLAKKKKEPEEW